MVGENNQEFPPEAEAEVGSKWFIKELADTAKRFQAFLEERDEIMEGDKDLTLLALAVKKVVNTAAEDITGVSTDEATEIWLELLLDSQTHYGKAWRELVEEFFGPTDTDIRKMAEDIVNVEERRQKLDRLDEIYNQTRGQIVSCLNEAGETVVDSTPQQEILDLISSLRCRVEVEKMLFPYKKSKVAENARAEAMNILREEGLDTGAWVACVEGLFLVEQVDDEGGGPGEV